MVLNVVFEHASVPAGGPQALRLLVDDVRQKFNPRPLAADPGATSRKVDAGSLHLLNTFMKTKLDRAGVLADAGHTGKWRLVWVVEEFFVVANRLENRDDRSNDHRDVLGNRRRHLAGQTSGSLAR